jgi:hypothetical protein
MKQKSYSNLLKDKLSPSFTVAIARLENAILSLSAQSSEMHLF